MRNRMLSTSVLAFMAFLVCLCLGASIHQKRQKMIDNARGLTEKLEVLGDILASDLREKIKKIGKATLYKKLGYDQPGKGMKLLVTYKEKNKIPKEYKHYIYEHLIAAITDGEELKEFVDDYNLMTLDLLDWLRKRESAADFVAVDESNTVLYEQSNSVLLITANKVPGENKITFTAQIQSKIRGTKILNTGNYNIDIKKIKADDITTGPNDLNPQTIQPIAWYRRPGSYDYNKISQGDTVHSGGSIFFEIKLPYWHGYLLVYLKDSKGKLFNLFPGTESAVVAGKYKIPRDIENPYTEVQNVTKESTNYLDISSKILRIGAFKFDNTKGSELFYFYYSAQRDKELETLIKKAIDTGTEIGRIKGVESILELVDKKKTNSKEGTFTYRFVHE